MKILITFIILNVFNVVLQTVKSLCTVKCGKVCAALVNAVTFGIYTVVIIYMNCDLALWLKCAIVAGANFIGVYVVKLIEEKARKDKIWEIKFCTPTANINLIKCICQSNNISYNYLITNNDRVIFNFYCETQEETTTVKRNITDRYEGKYFINETKEY